MKPFSFLLISTFIIGVLSGAYVYFLTRSSEPVFDFGSNETARGFEIIADAYGGCQMLGECPSYRIADDGSYIYLVSHRNADDDRYDGQLTAESFESLKDALRSAPLEKVVKSNFRGTCPVAADGAAYRYEIRIGGDTYSIDTCREDTEGVRFFTYLEAYFTYFNERHYAE